MEIDWEWLSGKKGIYFLTPFLHADAELVDACQPSGVTEFINDGQRSDWPSEDEYETYTDDGLHVKVGLSSNLKDRLKQYLLYYPWGYTLLGLVIVPNRSSISETEKSLHELLRKYQSQHVTFNSRAAEWFNLDRKMLKSLFRHLTITSQVSQTLYAGPVFVRNLRAQEEPKTPRSVVIRPRQKSKTITQLQPVTPKAPRKKKTK